ncbi:LPXTG cell wall anchor domain-containing protein [Streptomyces syringium]|uniref:LPXTG cell wall anchor domain-containing protein n=1 Tax=Streptomyces syringium TaxID=76729 RepID=UPI0034218223
MSRFKRTAAAVLITAAAVTGTALATAISAAAASYHCNTSKMTTDDPACRPGGSWNPPAIMPPLVAPHQLPAPTAQLAHTGAGNTIWFIGAGGILMAAGGGAVWAGSRRRRHTSTSDPQ